MERDDLGKEKRYPVLLTAAEKLIARKVVHAFKVSGESVDMDINYPFKCFSSWKG